MKRFKSDQNINKKKYELKSAVDVNYKKIYKRVVKEKKF